MGRRRIIPGLKIRRQFFMSLDQDLSQQLQTYMETFGMNAREEAYAVRDILKIHFSSVPEIGHIEAARRRAYLETKRWITERFIASLNEIADHMKLTELPDAARLTEIERNVIR